MIVVQLLLIAVWIAAVLYFVFRWSEDIDDVRVSQSRRCEKSVPLKRVKANLITSGKLPRR